MQQQIQLDCLFPAVNIRQATTSHPIFLVSSLPISTTPNPASAAQRWTCLWQRVSVVPTKQPGHCTYSLQTHNSLLQSKHPPPSTTSALLSKFFPCACCGVSPCRVSPSCSQPGERLPVVAVPHSPSPPTVHRHPALASVTTSQTPVRLHPVH